nr:ferritin-like domain-containing protein [Campylobacter anatolicus]
MSELSAQELYQSLIGFDKIFNEIYTIRQNAIELIKMYAKKYAIKLDDNAPNAFLKPDNLQDALISALNYEIQICKMYEGFTDELNDEELKDIFFRLWATSNNEYIKALKHALKAELSQDTQTSQQNINLNDFTQNGYENIINEYQKSFNEMNENLQNIINGKADKTEIAKILNNPNFPFFSGLALGAISITTISKNLNNQKDQTDD